MEPVSNDAKTAAVLRDLEAMQGARCAGCGAPLCGHHGVVSLVLGFKSAPRCLPCIARALDQEIGGLRHSLFEYVRHHACYTEGWRWAGEREGALDVEDLPCLRGNGAALAPEAVGPATSEWDAGDLSCGDLVLELRQRLGALAPGAIFKLTARDSGAPQDLPAWCRLTGHALVRAEPPVYWIRRKE